MEMIIHGDSIEKLKDLEDESVDLLCTDPPYGYSFMGKSWDKTLPDIQIFKECLRVLKPGAFAFVMSAPRSDVCSRMMLMLEDAGFEIGFTPIYWTYASGFPKAMNIGKMVDKRLGNKRKSLSVPNNKNNVYGKGMGGGEWNAPSEPAVSKEAQGLDGSYGGFQPKPAVEVIIVVMKPLSEKTFVDQALKNGKGITWLDDCRVPYEVNDYEKVKAKNVNNGVSEYKWEEGTNSKAKEVMRIDNPNGRFPANLLVSDDVLNDGRVTKSTGGSGKKSQDLGSVSIKGNGSNWTGGLGDSGSYSRYFDLDAWAKTLPFLIVPKASKREKNEGLEGFDEKPKKPYSGDMPKVTAANWGEPDSKIYERKTTAQNNHPTVKPLKLMSYLVTLGSREGDTILDPFLGSGTTALAAKNLGRKYIGIEREEEYVKIAEARLKEIQPTLL